MGDLIVDSGIAIQLTKGSISNEIFGWNNTQCMHASTVCKFDVDLSNYLSSRREKEKDS